MMIYKQLADIRTHRDNGSRGGDDPAKQHYHRADQGGDDHSITPNRDR